MMEAESGTLGKFGAGVKKTSPATSGGAFIDVIGADEYTAWKSKLIASYTIDVRDCFGLVYMCSLDMSL